MQNCTTEITIRQPSSESASFCDTCGALSVRLSDLSNEDGEEFTYMDDATLLAENFDQCSLCKLSLKTMYLEIERRRRPGRPVLPSPQQLLEKWQDMVPSYKLTMTMITGECFPNTIGEEAPSYSRIQVVLESKIKGQYLLRGPVNPLISLALSTPHSDPSYGKVVGNAQLADTGSPSALVLLNSWFRKCLAEHDDCRTSLSGGQIDDHIDVELPTRLVYVGNQENKEEPRLVITRGQRGTYTALSHCWGPPKQHECMTFQRTLQENQIAISFEKMPKNFQDAVIASRALGIQYVWIDSLCIVQDDPQDWAAEACRMCLVYQNAAITLAATDSKDSKGGLFHKPKMNETVDLPYTRIDQSQKIVGCFQLSVWDRPKAMALVQAPLCKRAWVTQEWALSRRLIHFQQTGLVWTCRTFAEGIHNQGIFKSLNYLNNDWKAEWSSTVHWYTGRGLTYQKDKLAALQGLADELGNLDDTDKYIYGLWLKGLPDQLLWTNNTSRYKPIDELISSVPSWSWAITEGNITFLGDYHRCVPMCSSLGVNDMELSVTCSIREFPLQDCHYWDDLDQKGEYLDKLRECFRLVALRNIVGRKRVLLVDKEESNDEYHTESVYGWIFFDADEIPESPIYCLQLLKIYGSKHFPVLGTLLVEDDVNFPGYMRRVGVGIIFSTEWFSAIERIIKIH